MRKPAPAFRAERTTRFSAYVCLVGFHGARELRAIAAQTVTNPPQDEQRRLMRDFHLARELQGADAFL
jgi:hypothetical protein